MDTQCMQQSCRLTFAQMCSSLGAAPKLLSLVPKMLLSGSGVSLAAGCCAHHLSFLCSLQSAAFVCILQCFAFTSAVHLTYFFSYSLVITERSKVGQYIHMKMFC